MNNTPAINRIGDILINWDHVESVSNHDNNIIVIWFKSGRKIEFIDKEKVQKLIDFYDVFPDVLDDETRIFMKQKSMKEQFSGKKTDMEIPVPQRFTDVTESNRGPSQDTLNWQKTKGWQNQLRQFKK
jgi:hypothetical protein